MYLCKLCKRINCIFNANPFMCLSNLNGKSPIKKTKEDNIFVGFQYSPKYSFYILLLFEFKNTIICTFKLIVNCFETIIKQIDMS